MILFAAAVGAIAGAILLFFSHIAPVFGAGNFIRDIDKPHVFGRSVTRREAHAVGALVHIVFASTFGGLFAYLVDIGIFLEFDLLSLLGWSLLMTLFVGGIVLPLEGHGVFGVKEDAWFPVDLLMTNVLWAVLFWWFIGLWPVLI